jgi:hypothetical protein
MESGAAGCQLNANEEDPPIEEDRSLDAELLELKSTNQGPCTAVGLLNAVVGWLV